MTQPKNCIIVGTGSRANMYIRHLCGHAREQGHRIVGLCDLNPGRMAVCNQILTEDYGLHPVPKAGIDDFEDLIRKQKADTVIVTSIDRTHDEYICRAMEAGCDAITEKPMTISAEKCRRILHTQQRTGKKLTVTFNYRYAPRNSKVKELLMNGAIGDVKSVHFEWLLNTVHGADYFRRWHRDKRNSGGLMVHKSTHHFDLVNWWLNASPKTVMAMGDLVFYGRANAEARGIRSFHTRGTDHPNAANDSFALDLAANENLKKLYLDNEHHDAYLRDQSVFSDGISIEDDVGVMVKYSSNAVMTYHLTAYSPWEGFRVMFNGTKGRLESEVVESPYISGADGDPNTPIPPKGVPPHEISEPSSLLLRPLWAPIRKIDLPETNEGGHGGGDLRMLEDIFGHPAHDPLGRAASHLDGAQSILTGIAANLSMARGIPVNTSELL